MTTDHATTDQPNQVRAPDFGALLASSIGRVPPETVPRFLALLERGAADRYRHWADALPDHRSVLLECAAGEDEIADRIEAAFDLDPSLRDALTEPLPEAQAIYLGVFDGLDVWDQLRIQADAERQGARAWRNIAVRITDGDVVAALAACSALEEASADRLDDLIATHAP